MSADAMETGEASDTVDDEFVAPEPEPASADDAPSGVDDVLDGGEVRGQGEEDEPLPNADELFPNLDAALATADEPFPSTDAPIATVDEPQPETGGEPELETGGEPELETGGEPQPETGGEPEPETGGVPAAPPADQIGAADETATGSAAAAAPTPAVRRSVGHAVAAQLAAAGTRFAFTVPGESFLDVLDGFRAAGVRVVATRHEGAAAFMAAAASQLTGKPQVVMATRAVGASNAAIGIHAARADSAPLVAIFGQVRRGYRGREAFQESELVSAPGGLALWAAEARDEGDALRIVNDGLRHQVSGRPGPIVLAFPEDVQAADAPSGWEPSVAASPTGPGADRDEVRRTLKLLAAAERPAIIAGGGVLRARASKRLTLLAEALEVPIFAAWRRPDVIPNDHPLYLGMTGYWGAPTVLPRLEEADAILVIGARLNEITTFGYRIPGEGARWVHVDLEPRAATAGLAAPTISVTADVARFLDACWSDLRGAALDNEMRTRRQARNAADRQAYVEARRVDDVPGEGSGVHPGRVIAALQEQLPADALITTDAGNFGSWPARGYRFGRPGTFLGTTSGAMGYGFPAAIAGALLRPDRPTVALAGDGGFAMTMAEIETAVRERARVIALVFDNGGYGTIRMQQVRNGLAETGTILGPIDFAAVANAAGALGLTVERDEEFAPALTEALAARRPVVIHLRVDPRWVSVDEGPTNDQIERDIASAP